MRAFLFFLIAFVIAPLSAIGPSLQTASVFPVFFVSAVTEQENGLLSKTVSHWNMNEESGSRADSHGSNTLTDVNTVLFNTGKIGNAADFVAAQEEGLTIVDNASLSITGPLSISFWVNLDTIASFQYLVSKYDLATNGRSYTIYFNNSSSKIAANTSSDGTFQAANAVESTATISTGVWYHVVFTFEPSVASRIYVDTVVTSNTSTVPAAIFDSTTLFAIGRRSDGVVWFDGRIDSVTIFDETLDASDVSNLNNSDSGLDYPFFD